MVTMQLVKDIINPKLVNCVKKVFPYKGSDVNHTITHVDKKR
jgi:hypothetical protein